MEVLENLLKPVSRHYVGDEEVSKHAVLRPVHLHRWQGDDTHIGADAKECLHLIHSDRRPMAVRLLGTLPFRIEIGLFRDTLEIQSENWELGHGPIISATNID